MSEKLTMLSQKEVENFLMEEIRISGITTEFIETFEKYLKKYPELIESIDINCSLVWADDWVQDSVFNQICQEKADLDSRMVSDDFIEILLQNGADINSLDLCNMTPLMHAVNCCNIEFVKLLLKYNPDLFKGSLSKDCKFYKKTVLHMILNRTKNYEDWYNNELYKIFDLLIKKLEELVKR